MPNPYGNGAHGVDRAWMKNGPWTEMSDDEFIEAYLQALREGKKGGIHVLQRLKQISKRRAAQEERYGL